MLEYKIVQKTLKNLNLSYLEDVFRAYKVHDNIVLTLTISQLSAIIPRQEAKFRKEFQMLYGKQENVNTQTPDSEHGRLLKDLLIETDDQLIQIEDQPIQTGDQSLQTKDQSTQTESNEELQETRLISSTIFGKPSPLEINLEHDQLPKKGTMSEQTKKNLITAGIIGGVAVGTCAVAVVAAPLVIAAAGFGSAGVVAGSIAAAWQATIGNVVAGSIFAGLQSAGVLGLASGTTAAIGAAGGTVGAATATGIMQLVNNKKKRDQETQTT